MCLKDLRHIKRLDLAVEFQERTVGGEIREVMAAGASLGRDFKPLEGLLGFAASEIGAMREF